MKLEGVSHAITEINSKWIINTDSDPLHHQGSPHFFLNRFLLFVEDKYVLSQCGCLILAPTRVCLATKLQIQARNRQKSDGHVLNEIPGNGPTHIGAGVEFLALWKCSAKSSSPSSLFLYKWLSPVQWTELSPETHEEDVSPSNPSDSQSARPTSLDCCANLDHDFWNGWQKYFNIVHIGILFHQ